MQIACLLLSITITIHRLFALYSIYFCYSTPGLLLLMTHLLASVNLSNAVSLLKDKMV